MVALQAMELLDEIIVTMRRMHQPLIAAVIVPMIGRLALPRDGL